jgi:hypothetical protein
MLPWGGEQLAAPEQGNKTMQRQHVTETAGRRLPLSDRALAQVLSRAEAHT